jgi:RNA polymerase sigma factor (sigma-70 family)
MAAAKAQATTSGRAEDAAERVAAMLHHHRGTLLRVARRWSACEDDAEDAVQRAFEIYVRRLPRIDPATEVGWLKVVVRNEALDIRRARGTGVPLDAVDVGERLPSSDAAVHELMERDERVARSREAIAQLKPDERTALLLNAEGYSYREIGERQGWTYTKVNRAITEGRKRFRDAFAQIESGEACERHRPTLVALAAGAAASADVLALRPHLRHCAACRATVRDLHASALHRLALHLPFLAGVAPLRWLGDRVVDSRAPGETGLKGLAHSALQRITGPDAMTSAQLASTGGGRGAAIAAVLSLCLGGGAGTYCLATGGLPDPIRSSHRAEHREPSKPKAPRRRAERATATPTPVATTPLPAHEPIATTASQPPASRPKPREERRPRERKRRADPAGEFGFESSTAGTGGSTTPAPATATTASSSPPPQEPPASSSPPPTSGGEFLP